MTTCSQIDVVDSLAAAGLRKALLHEVRHGLAVRPRSLAPWMFYDARGSDLFERITALPEYYPTRTERGILARFADGIIAASHTGGPRPFRLVELGAGTAAKTGILLRAAARAQAEVLYMPVDVSLNALNVACQNIENAFPEVRIDPLVVNYVTHPLQFGAFDGATVVLYLGSSISNFSPEEARAILGNLTQQLQPGDALVLGIDLVKDESTLVAAYDDGLGVTAAFNLNILDRLNRELDADFDLAGFRHRAVWNPVESRIEMHLESIREQWVHIAAAQLSLRLERGETIHTENSYKFTDESIRELLCDSGFAVATIWKDPRAWYAVVLARPIGPSSNAGSRMRRPYGEGEILS